MFMVSPRVALRYYGRGKLSRAGMHIRAKALLYETQLSMALLKAPAEALILRSSTQ
jgi:hypothetical protein